MLNSLVQLGSSYTIYGLHGAQDLDTSPSHFSIKISTHHSARPIIIPNDATMDAFKRAQVDLEQVPINDLS